MLLCWVQHQAHEYVCGSGGVGPHILILGTRCRYSVTTTMFATECYERWTVETVPYSSLSSESTRQVQSYWLFTVYKSDPALGSLVAFRLPIKELWNHGCHQRRKAGTLIHNMLLQLLSGTDYCFTQSSKTSGGVGYSWGKSEGKGCINKGRILNDCRAKGQGDDLNMTKALVGYLFWERRPAMCKGYLGHDWLELVGRCAYNNTRNNVA
jgi:hypothetical protein